MGFKISNGIVLSVISFDPKSSSCRSTEGSTISIVTPIFSISRLSILYSINLQICSNLKFLLNHFSFPGSSPRPAIIFIWSSHTTHRCLTAHDRLFFFFFFFFICIFFFFSLFFFFFFLLSFFFFFFFFFFFSSMEMSYISPNFPHVRCACLSNRPVICRSYQCQDAIKKRSKS